VLSGFLNAHFKYAVSVQQYNVRCDLFLLLFFFVSCRMIVFWFGTRKSIRPVKILPVLALKIVLESL